MSVRKTVWGVFFTLIAIVILFFPAWHSLWAGIKLTQAIRQIESSAANYAQTLTATNNQAAANVDQFRQDFNQLNQRLANFIQRVEKSPLAQQVMQDRFNQLKSAHKLLIASYNILDGRHTYILLLQNSEELRATGGFMGAYGKLVLNQGQLEELQIQDIYVPDGQFEGFVPAPTGAKEYLSGGQGLKLRDANWHPDFPTTAQGVLNYFAWGQEAEIEGLVAINLPVVEELLSITGPIYLADYDQEVTAKNFSDVARADRHQFFPGSQQKKHFLSLFLNQLIFKLNKLDLTQQQQLLRLMMAQAKQKNTQFFSNQPQLQASFEELHIAGQLTKPTNTSSILWLESNVGINKANQHLERGVLLELGQTTSLLEATFTNRNFPPMPDKIGPNEADHLGYVNYQRLILSPEFDVEQITFDGQKIDSWDEAEITNSKGQAFKQIGFLITVPEQTTKKLKLKLIHPALEEPVQLWLQKQSGLPPSPYTLTYQHQSKSLTLEKDTLVEFMK